MEDRWIRTNQAEDVAGSVRHAIRAAGFVSEDPLAWKWVIIALHSALQGACVCHLTTTAPPFGAVTKRNAYAWLTYFEDSRTDPTAKPPPTRLMALPELLKAVRKPESPGDRSNATGIKISDDELSWLRRFHEHTRNQFVHFEPRAWAIDVSGVPEIAKLIARIIEDILRVGWAFRRQTPLQLEEMQQNLHDLARI